MPVTVRSLLVSQVSGAGKKSPTNLRYDPAKQHIVNLSCDCGPQLPSPITINYTVAGSYTDTLPVLPNGYSWRIVGTIISGGGGGGGGGGNEGGAGGLFSGGGGGGGSVNVIFSVAILTSFLSGASIISVVGSGGAGGAGGPVNTAGSDGLPGNSSSITSNGAVFSSPPSIGGIGGPITGSPVGQSGGTEPGSGGSGGNGSSNPGEPGDPGGRGKDGRVVFTATPIQI